MICSFWSGTPRRCARLALLWGNTGGARTTDWPPREAGAGREGVSRASSRFGQHDRPWSIKSCVTRRSFLTAIISCHRPRLLCHRSVMLFRVCLCGIGLTRKMARFLVRPRSFFLSVGKQAAEMILRNRAMHAATAAASFTFPAQTKG